MSAKDDKGADKPYGVTFECESVDTNKVKVLMPNRTYKETNVPTPPNPGAGAPREERLALAGELVQEVKYRLLREDNYPEATFDNYQMLIIGPHGEQRVMDDGGLISAYRANLCTGAESYLEIRLRADQVCEGRTTNPGLFGFQLSWAAIFAPFGPTHSISAIPSVFAYYDMLEVVFVNIVLPLQFEECKCPQDVLIDDDMFSWTVAEVKQHLVSQGSLAHLRQPPEFLDMLVRVAGGGDNYASTQDILLRDSDVLAHYSHYLHAGQSLLLRRRKLECEDYMTYWTRRLEQMGINADVMLVMFLVVAIIVTGALFGMHSVEETIWWQH